TSGAICSTARTSDAAPAGSGGKRSYPRDGRPHLVDGHELHAVVGAAWTTLAAVASTRATREIALDDHGTWAERPIPLRRHCRAEDGHLRDAGCGSDVHGRAVVG